MPKLKTQKRQISLKIALLLAATFVSSPALAESGYYMSGAVGYNSPEDVDGSGALGDEMVLDEGAAGLLSFGYQTSDYFRAEFELGFRGNDVDRTRTNTAGAGELTATTYMLNALYDLDYFGRFVPYIGLGLGIADVEADNVTNFSSTTLNSSDAVFAYQGIAGAAYEVTPTLDLFLDYHYLKAEPDIRALTGTDVNLDYADHAMFFGLRYRFGGSENGFGDEYEETKRLPEPPMPLAVESQPLEPREDEKLAGLFEEDQPESAPEDLAAQDSEVSEVYEEVEEGVVEEQVMEEAAPKAAPKAAEKPAPVPTPAAPIVHTIYFNMNSSVLTSKAKSTISKAAEEIKQGQAAEIVVVGYTDTTGSSEYNTWLSERRATKVKRQMVTNGVPESEIDLAYRGEGALAVSTADGVANALNRRVTIEYLAQVDPALK